MEESDPRHHTANLRQMLVDIATHAREDVGKIDEPRAQALFETTAEVCSGLATAYEHYDAQAGPAWKRQETDNT
jgi:hypothetical protein